MKTKLQSFLDENCPKNVIFNAQAVQVACKKVSFSFKMIGGKIEIKKDSVCNITFWGDVVEVMYFISLEGGELVCRPAITKTRMFNGAASSIEHFIKEGLGLGEVRVTLPEETILLPIPEWVTVSPSEGWFSVEVLPLFKSEAEVMLQKFISEANKALE